ncbi:hypothetical protein [uncultured Brevundimonas sp.]|uniref:hypothetical protein n=1 Tax=uncultured Brevundimonas sp. TaxID=213418 RepID=UPI0030EEAAEC|tara:strand:- start:243 stop:968 length:726 start_codon:yes stop_codon:yes gene_type:complete
MIWWWWILPAVVGGLGLMLTLFSLGKLFSGRILGGGLGTIGGGGMIAVAAIAALTGLNVQTYARLTHERPVATIELKQLGPQYFETTVSQPGSDETQPGRSDVYMLNGDDWRIEAQVLKWKPWANVIGLDTQYRLDRLSGRYQSIDQELNSTRSVHALSGGDRPTTLPGNITLPWKISVWDMARRYRRHVDAVDTLYGSAAYMPMADGAKYEVWISQSGLVARPVNDAARNASSGGWTRVE